jgi:hypothetical protein
MGPFFHGGERIQRGRGIGGLLRIVSKLFKPLGSLAVKVVKSPAGKRIVNAVKNQAIDSSINVAKDLASGKGVKESLKDEFDNVKESTKRKVLTLGTDYLKENNSSFPSKRGKETSVRSRKKPKLKRRRDIFD